MTTWQKYGTLCTFVAKEGDDEVTVQCVHLWPRKAIRSDNSIVQCVHLSARKATTK